MVKILHFADAHIDMANYGRHDPESGLPMRVMDFLKSLDEIVDAAIEEKVDLVVFAGDAYKDRNPAPTFQREWGKRIMRLSNEGIPTILLVGNHDLSPSIGRAHALEEFKTLEVDNIFVADRPTFYTPEELGIPIQVAAMPWITRSGMLAQMDIKANKTSDIYELLEDKLNDIVDDWLKEADPEIPTMLTAHATVQGAVYGGERTVMLGGDLTLGGALVKHKGIDYTALGHIHKPQNLGGGPKPEDGQGVANTKDDAPPVIYPGSIERVDFGEAEDKKYYVIAEVNKGETHVYWHELKNIRKFLSSYVTLDSDEKVTETIRAALPKPKDMQDAIVRLILEYPREREALIDEAALREYTSEAFEFHLIKRPQMDTRVRIPDDKNIGSMTPLELLDIYWRSTHLAEGEQEILMKLAEEVIDQTHAENSK